MKPKKQKKIDRVIALLERIAETIEKQGVIRSEERRADRSELLAVMARAADPARREAEISRRFHENNALPAARDPAARDDEAA
jgi:hypothetical protein